MSPPDGVVKITCNVPSAEVWVDERYVAEVSSLIDGIAVSPGNHRLEIRHDDYHTFYTEIDVTPRGQGHVVANLVAQLR